MFVAVEPADMRKSFSGLYALTANVLKELPDSGGLFVFTNQREYLLDVLTRLPAMKITEVAERTPARWLAAKRAAGKNQAA